MVMKDRAPAIGLATLLVYLARALFFAKDLSPLDNLSIAAIFGVIAFILKYGIKYVAKLTRTQLDYEKLSTEWTSSLLFGLIVAMVIVNLDGLSNMNIGTPNLYEFLRGPLPAAIAVGIFATILTFLKYHGQISYSRTYAIMSVFLTAFLVFAFVYSG